MAPREAALKGAREIGFTVISHQSQPGGGVHPILLMGGVVGRLFREFAVVLSAAIVVSMVVSLTTTPMMAPTLLASAGLPVCHTATLPAAGRLDRPHRQASGAAWLPPLADLDAAPPACGHCWRWWQWWRSTCRSTTPSPRPSSRSRTPASCSGGQCAGRPGQLVPDDAGAAGQVHGHRDGRPGGGACERLHRRRWPAQLGANFFITLKPLAERQISADAVVARLREKLAHEPGANLFFVPVQDVRIGGRQSNAQYQYTLQADDLADLRTWEPRVRNALSQLPELTDVNTDQQDKGMQTSLVIDRDAARPPGRDMSATWTPRLNNAFGQRQVGVIYNALNQYRVVMEAGARIPARPGDAEAACTSPAGPASRCRCRPLRAWRPPTRRCR